MKRVVVTDHAFGQVDVEQATAEQVGARFEVFQVRDESRTVDALRDADVALVNFAPITDAVLAAMNSNGVVIRYGVGYDNIDVAAANKYGITVCNIPDYGVNVVADHTMMLALALQRRLMPIQKSMTDGDWLPASEFAPILAPQESIFGLIGFGRTAQAVAQRARAFGYAVISSDPYVSPEQARDLGASLVTLEEVFETSDILSLHATATPQNLNLVNEERIQTMKRGAYLINTARGALVDHQAVAAALQSGALGGVGFDVFDNEPLPKDHPLRTHPNAILTPHVAFYSRLSMLELQRLAAEEMARAVAGQPLRSAVN